MSAEVMNNHGLATSYKRVEIPKNEQERQLISNIMSENILFADLDDAERTDCIDAFFRVDVKKGEIVISQGSHGDNFYAIDSGTLDIYVAVGKSPPIKYGELSEGMGFGELALLCNTPRAATIQASTDAVLWAIARTTYRGKTRNANQQTHAHIGLRNLHVSRTLPAGQVPEISPSSSDPPKS